MSDRKTQSETLFERFLTHHCLPFEPVPVADSPRPDYTVGVGTDWGPLSFEVKEISEDEDFKQGQFAVSKRKVGEHIRSKIRESTKQIQYGAKQGVPSILLIYNALDTAFHMFGTEDHDFRAAMHGEWTLWMSTQTGKILEADHGRNRSFREDSNTSFSALAHLVPVRGVMTVRVYLNEHAKVPLPTLPTCFEIA